MRFQLKSFRYRKRKWEEDGEKVKILEDFEPVVFAELFVAIDSDDHWESCEQLEFPNEASWLAFRDIMAGSFHHEVYIRPTKYEPMPEDSEED